MVQQSLSADLHTLLETLLKTGEPVLFEHKGQEYALITKEDFEYFEELQDSDDIRTAQDAIREMKKKNESTIPYDKVRKDLGLNK